MIEQKQKALQFSPITLSDRAAYEACLAESEARGCEYSFPNLYFWGAQNVAFVNGCAVLFSCFGDHFVYLYPVGRGVSREIIDAILAHAEEQGIALRLSGIIPSERDALEAMYPDFFSFSCNVGSHDYVYAIDDLADLEGKKYDGKRNHCRRFESLYPDCETVEIDEKSIDAVRLMAKEWYAQRREADPDGEYSMEECALTRALDHYRELSLDGIALVQNGRVLAFSIGNRMSTDTVDVNFEKAASDVQGGYAAINRAFARHIRAGYPAVRFLNREEDMGIEGLRRAKESYKPHHRVVKYTAKRKVSS